MIPVLQYSPSKSPPLRSVFININGAIPSLLKTQIRWENVFNRALMYYNRWKLHWATFPYQTQRRYICEVEVTWSNPTPAPVSSRGATNGWPVQQQTDDFLVHKSYVWIAQTTSQGQVITQTTEELIGDFIAHEVGHWFNGPGHIDPKDYPISSGEQWLMAPWITAGPKRMDNITALALDRFCGPKD